jgi:EAL domain-containing protein (putative c-di-GMP-specific phosphodiesterase class I)
MTVVAEGVETQQHLDVLTASGCSRVQGYRFSQPVPAEQYCKWHLAWNGGTAWLRARSA